MSKIVEIATTTTQQWAEEVLKVSVTPKQLSLLKMMLNGELASANEEIEAALEKSLNENAKNGYFTTSLLAAMAAQFGMSPKAMTNYNKLVLLSTFAEGEGREIRGKNDEVFKATKSGGPVLGANFQINMVKGNITVGEKYQGKSSHATEKDEFGYTPSVKEISHGWMTDNIAPTSATIKPFLTLWTRPTTIEACYPLVQAAIAIRSDFNTDKNKNGFKGTADEWLIKNKTELAGRIKEAADKPAPVYTTPTTPTSDKRKPK